VWRNLSQSGLAWSKWLVVRVALETGIFQLLADDAVEAFLVPHHEANLEIQLLDRVLLANVGAGFVIAECQWWKNLSERHCVVVVWWSAHSVEHIWNQQWQFESTEFNFEQFVDGRLVCAHVELRIREKRALPACM
jgi:hypothetical protein